MHGIDLLAWPPPLPSPPPPPPPIIPAAAAAAAAAFAAAAPGRCRVRRGRNPPRARQQRGDAPRGRRRLDPPRRRHRTPARVGARRRARRRERRCAGGGPLVPPGARGGGSGGGWGAAGGARQRRAGRRWWHCSLRARGWAASGTTVRATCRSLRRLRAGLPAAGPCCCSSVGVSARGVERRRRRGQLPYTAERHWKGDSEVVLGIVTCARSAFLSSPAATTVEWGKDGGDAGLTRSAPIGSAASAAHDDRGATS